MFFSLAGKIAAVTGSTKWLGQAIATALAQAGADIIGIDRTEAAETAERVRQEGRQWYHVQADLSQPDTMGEVAARALAVSGRVDILVNNAGVTLVRPAGEYSEQDFDTTMNVNVKSLFLVTREIGRGMIERRYGKIINICSIQSIIAGNNVSAYVASKHAVAGITRAFANEWGRYGINVNGIAPGFMVTDNTKLLRENTGAVAAITARIPLGRWGKPADIMGPVVFLASDEAAFVNGHLLVVDGGYLNN